MKDPETGFTYCCKLNQTIQERKEEKAKMPDKP